MRWDWRTFLSEKPVVESFHLLFTHFIKKLASGQARRALYMENESQWLWQSPDCYCSLTMEVTFEVLKSGITLVEEVTFKASNRWITHSYLTWCWLGFLRDYKTLSFFQLTWSAPKCCGKRSSKNILCSLLSNLSDSPFALCHSIIWSSLQMDFTISGSHSHLAWIGFSDSGV